ncbi:D-erythronate dehydrogenase [Larkinella bovis]|uniref:D-erythronate dehydrogenase n=1 Tax=Larkinella bovis TaxID=683041 RepID=A0ABW0ICX5_9BACT
MQILITGGAGFLGQRLAQALLSSDLAFDELLLVDRIQPSLPGNDSRVRCQPIDLTETGAAKRIISEKTGIVFHLAAVVSSQAEREFDLGWAVNLDLTRQLLETCRQQKPGIRFVFASGFAVFGGHRAAVIDDATVVTPQSSYGTQKAIVELLVNDYTRKNFVDGRVLRLPTICVRPGRPNQAASSFVSSIIREPLNGEPAVCPVSPDLTVLVSSPDTIIRNLLQGARLDGTAFGNWRTVNLPGIGVTIRQMLDSLERLTGPETVARIAFQPDPTINAIVSSWPQAVDNTRALRLGFAVDSHFDDFIRQFLARPQV